MWVTFFVAEEEVYLVVDFGLGEDGDPVLVVWLAFCLGHVVA